jgi:hypothetical protein
MPITGTGPILGQLMKQAVDQETAAAIAAGRPVDRDAMFNAIGNAVEQWLVANGAGAVVGTATGVMSGPSAAPVIGNIT